MNMMTYRGQVASIHFDPEDDLLVGRLLGTADVIGFHADTVSGLRQAFHEAVDDYLTARDRVDGRLPEHAA